MSRRARIIRNIAIGAAVLIVALVVAAMVTVQTRWFGNLAAGKIAAALEEGTGGRVEIGSFQLDPRRLRAVITGLVVHGHEPAGAPPYLSARRVEVDVRLLTSLKHIWNISYLGLDTPQANIMVFADGSTNVPSPKSKTESKDTPLATVVDLAIGHVDLANGLVLINSHPQAVNVRANNVRLRLAYDMLKEGYRGQVSLEPLYVASGRNTPVSFAITVPVTLQRDRIDVQNARIATALSEITISGTVENLRDPKTKARVSGHVAVADLKNAADLPLASGARGAPQVVEVYADASAAGDAIRVSGLRLALGDSLVEASGNLKDGSGAGQLDARVHLALDELGRLAGLAARPEGTVDWNGTARLDAGNNYLVTGQLQGRNISVQQASKRTGNLNVVSAVRMDQHRLDLQNLRLTAYGAEVAANASLEELARFRVEGDLRHLDLREAARMAGQNLPYDAVVSGPISAQGDLKAPGTKAMAASARLSLAPGRGGIPVSGRLIAAYDGAADDVEVRNSYLALPHTRLEVEGSLGRRLSVVLTSRDLRDLFAAIPGGKAPPIALDGGQLSFTGLVTGRLASPAVSGHLAVSRFQVEARRFDALAMDVSAASTGAAIANGNLSRGTLQAQFRGSAGLRNWKPEPNQPLGLTASVRGADLADALALAGEPSEGYSGALSADAAVSGTQGNPNGSAQVQVAQGTLKGEAFDNAQVRVEMTDQLVSVPVAFISAPPARIDLSAEFRHPRDSFASGQLHAHVGSSQVDLARLRSIQAQRPRTSGQVQIDADLAGDVAPGTGFAPSRINGNISARGLQADGQNYGDLTASAVTNGQVVNYTVNSDFAGSNLRVSGNTRFAPGYPTTADASLAHLPVGRVLALAKQDTPVRGSLSGTAHITGTIDNPGGQADFDLANGQVYGEPVDHVRARVAYAANSVSIPQFEILSGQGQLDLTARYDHAPGNLQSGDFQFRVDSSRLDLAHIRNLQRVRPGLAGVLQIAASGAGTVKPAGARVAFRDLNADVSAKGIAAQGRSYGDLALNAHTAGGRLAFALDSDLAGSAIHGSGSAQLAGDYPVTAKLTFDNVAWSRLQPLVEGGGGPGFEAEAAGEAEVNGPAAKTDQLHGSLQVKRLRFAPAPGPGTQRLEIQNQGPITATLEGGVVRLQGVHLSGPQTDLQASGSYAIATQAITASVKANSNLAVLERLSQEVVSSGNVVLSADVRGTTAKPLINGRVELHNASLNYTEIPNGISNANGVIQFNGNTAVVENLTGEVGGGKLAVNGFASYGDTPRFGLRATANNVRVRPQEGLSAVAGANLQLTGGLRSSLISGTVTIDEISYAPTSDFGSILSRAAPPVQNASTPSPLLDNMKLAVQVRTSPSLTVQASMAENLELQANLQVRGTASRPGVLGRITITEGQLLFFSSTYTVNSGTISFYNPVRIDPILNLSLETQAQGVDVVLKVTGPIDNMKLSYTSDPPLQFQEIVGLLAAGKTPTSDPNILVNQPTQPPQTFQQMGESAILSKALADPLANRLQRVFGVSQLSIDPTFTSGSDLPQARVSLRQRISSNMTFTYVTAVNDPNAQIIRVQWDVNPQWSAIAGRDENGLVSIRFLYKKQFR